MNSELPTSPIVTSKANPSISTTTNTSSPIPPSSPNVPAPEYGGTDLQAATDEGLTFSTSEITESTEVLEIVEDAGEEKKAYESALFSGDRDQIIKRLGEFIAMDDLNSYRHRAEFVEQLIAAVDLFDGISANRHFCGFALAYSADRIVCIRDKGIELLAAVIGVLLRDEWERFVVGDEEENPSCTDLVCLALTDPVLHEARNCFWNSRNWRKRQSFARLLHILLEKRITTSEQFCYLFYEDLMRVSEDSVPNVRQYFCMIAQLSAESNFFEACDSTIRDAIRRRLEKMSAEDADREICHLANVALGREENVRSETAILTPAITTDASVADEEDGEGCNVTEEDNKENYKDSFNCFFTKDH